MSSGWNAFREGLKRSLRYPQIVILLWLVSLLSASLLGLLPSLSLLGPAHRTAIQEAADGLEAWMVIESLLSPVNRVQAAQGNVRLDAGVQQLLLTWALAALLVPLAAWFPSAFLYGGALQTYAEAPQTFRWRRFLGACWRWWGSFLVLGGLEFMAGLLLVLFLGAIAALGAPGLGAWILWPLLTALLLCGLFILIVAELARAAAVTGGRRNVFYALSQAFSAGWRKPVSLSVFFVSALLWLALIHLAFRAGLLPRLPLATWPLVLAALQAFVLLRILARLSRLAGEVNLVQEALPGKPAGSDQNSLVYQNIATEENQK